MAEDFIERKNFRKYWKLIHPSLKPFVGDTYGLIVYQEQVMQIVADVAGLGWGIANKIRKVIAKSQGADKMQEYEQMFVDGCLKMKTLNEQEATAMFTDFVAFGGYGFNRCFAGDCKIVRDNKARWQPTIEEMYKTKNDILWAKENGHLALRKKYKSFGYGFGFSLDENNRIKTNKIVDITYQGKKIVHEIKLSNGYFIKVTSNHNFPVLKNEKIEYKCIDTGLMKGDKLIVPNGYEKDKNNHNFSNKTMSREFNKYNGRGFKEGEKNPSYTNGEFTKFDKNKSILKSQAKGICQKCHKETSRIEIHHKDGTMKNNGIDDLIALCPSCHKKEHYKLNRTKKNEKGYSINESKIVSIKECAPQSVYDVTMQSPFHTVLVNDILAKNSHSVEYSHITLWDMYLKVYYPLEFYCASLSFCSDTNRQNLVDDAWENGIEIRSPKIGKSLANIWNIVDNKLYAPLCIIKGIGDKTAEKIEKMNSPIEEKETKQLGFFIKKEEVQKVNTEKSIGRYKDILESIEAYADKRLTAQWSRDKYEYFGFYFRRR